MIFFFSSRRRHTRYIGDWSSDVCSSDLDSLPSRSTLTRRSPERVRNFFSGRLTCCLSLRQRSEERRVGKECRYVSGWIVVVMHVFGLCMAVVGVYMCDIRTIILVHICRI